MVGIVQWMKYSIQFTKFRSDARGPAIGTHPVLHWMHVKHVGTLSIVCARSCLTRSGAFRHFEHVRKSIECNLHANVVQRDPTMRYLVLGFNPLRFVWLRAIIRYTAFPSKFNPSGKRFSHFTMLSERHMDQSVAEALAWVDITFAGRLIHRAMGNRAASSSMLAVNGGLI